MGSCSLEAGPRERAGLLLSEAKAAARLGPGEVPGAAAARGDRADPYRRFANAVACLVEVELEVAREERAQGADEMEGHHLVARHLSWSGEAEEARVPEAAPGLPREQRPGGLLAPHRREAVLRAREVPLEEVGIEEAGA